MLTEPTHYNNLSVKQVEQLQSSLSELGYYPFTMIDGKKGYVTEEAIKHFAEDHWLNTDQTLIIGKTFLNRLESEILRKSTSKIRDYELKILCQVYDLELNVLKAFLQVEAQSKGFIDDYPKILYESHYFYDLTSGKYGTSDISSRNWNRNLYKGGLEEYSRLGKAMLLDYESALKSCSWGLGQVMGIHWKNLGYRTITEFVKSMFLSERNQVKTILEYMVMTGLLEHAREKDWKSLARGYNGERYWVHNYDGKLARAYLTLNS